MTCNSYDMHPAKVATRCSVGDTNVVRSQMNKIAIKSGVQSYTFPFSFSSITLLSLFLSLHDNDPYIPSINRVERDLFENASQFESTFESHTRSNLSIYASWKPHSFLLFSWFWLWLYQLLTTKPRLPNITKTAQLLLSPKRKVKITLSRSDAKANLKNVRMIITLYDVSLSSSRYILD